MTVSRRRCLALIAAMPLMTKGALAAGSGHTAYEYSFEASEGGKIDLARYAGQPMLIVNTASRCGFAAQLNSLETLWTQYKDQGLYVLGVPSGDFGGQELAGNAQIKQFCALNFGVSFPLAAKCSVIGPQAHPFFRWAESERPGEGPKWNFHKYLVGRDGHIASVFPTSIDPMDRRVVSEIETVLKSAAHKQG